MLKKKKNFVLHFILNINVEIKFSAHKLFLE